MSFNLNYTHKNEYALNVNLIDECIRLYGIEAKMILTEKNNLDPVVFGDWSGITTNGSNIFDIHLLPANADDLDHGGYRFSDFGFNDFDTSEVFISTKEAVKYELSIEKMLSSVIIFPSNKVLEVTDVEHQVPGINHLWAYSDAKSAFKLTLRTYEFKLHDDIEQEDLINSIETENPDTVQNKIDNYDALDGYFETLLKEEQDQDYEAEIKEVNVTKDYKEVNLDEKVKKPTVILDEKDPYGW